MLRPLKFLVQDPPPAVIVEISAVGVSAVRRDSKTGEIAGRARVELAPGWIDPSPHRSNVPDADSFHRAVDSVLNELGELRRPDVALILPDNCSRLTVIDFDSLPGDANERLRLIRFRLKRTVPFDVEEARIVYRTWPARKGLVALVAATPAEIIRQYEAPFEHRGLWPGYVSLSTCSALNLLPDGPMTLFVRKTGNELTMAAVDQGVVRMVRSIEIADSSSSKDDWSEAAREVYPTLVFVEDHFGVKISKLVLCGLDSRPTDTDYEVEPLRSMEGIVDSREAGIWGFLSAN